MWACNFTTKNRRCSDPMRDESVSSARSTTIINRRPHVQTDDEVDLALIRKMVTRQR